MPTLAEIVDAVWSTEIQPGLTAREILAAWLRYVESGADAIAATFVSGGAGGGRITSMFYPDDRALSALPFDIEADDLEVIKIAFAFLRNLA